MMIDYRDVINSWSRSSRSHSAA